MRFVYKKLISFTKIDFGLTKMHLVLQLTNKIVRFQITVDGMENEHNRSRYLTDKRGTWKTIINNLKYFNEINNREVSVLIRTNITPEIYENIDEWLEFLNDNFNNSQIFRMHFEAAKNYGK